MKTRKTKWHKYARMSGMYRFSCRRAFTLIELSIVILVLALLANAALRYTSSLAEINSVTTTNGNLDVVETALLNYVNEYGRLPCPADLTQAENTSSFGTEIYAASTGGTLGDGNCGYISSGNNNAAYGTGGLYIDTTTDPDAASGSDNNYGGAADPLYDSTTLQKVVQGAIPTKTLRIADKYAYDAWGNKIFYSVDIRTTATTAFSTYSVGNTTVGAIVIKKIATDKLVNALSYNAIYALVSTGKDRHGGFARNLGSTAIRVNASSANTDQLDNCHCSSVAVATSFNRIFVQKTKAIDYTSAANTFDDMVRFKTRGNIGYSQDLQ